MNGPYFLLGLAACAGYLYVMSALGRLLARRCANTSTIVNAPLDGEPAIGSSRSRGRTRIAS